MSKGGSKRFLTHHGYGELRPSRYVALYLAQLCWFLLGAFLYWGAFWPSTCTPENFIEVYTCSFGLPDSGGWREGALLTWLWATPILIFLEISRRFGPSKE